jgi:hypothetical protein
MKLASLAGAFACALSIAACSTLPNGDEGVAGIDIGISAAQVQVAAADVQKAVNALPQICNDFQNALALTQAEIAVLQAGGVKLPAKTVANISNASAKGLLICKGTAAIVAPAAQAPAQ